MLRKKSEHLLCILFGVLLPFLNSTGMAAETYCSVDPSKFSQITGLRAHADTVFQKLEAVSSPPDPRKVRIEDFYDSVCRLSDANFEQHSMQAEQEFRQLMAENKERDKFTLKRLIESRMFPESVKSKINDQFSISRSMIKDVLTKYKIIDTTDEAGRYSLDYIALSMHLKWPSQDILEDDIHKIATGMEAFTRPVFNSIQLYGGMRNLEAPTHIFAFGHELGHGIDHHKYMGSSDANEDIKTCLQVEDKATDITSETIGEAIADWYGTESLALYLKNNASLSIEQKRDSALGVVKMFCDPHFKNIKEGDPHPPAKSRITRVFLAHPYIKMLFGYSKTKGARYCHPGKSSIW